MSLFHMLGDINFHGDFIGNVDPDMFDDPVNKSTMLQD